MKASFITCADVNDNAGLVTGFLRLEMPRAAVEKARPPVHLSIIIDASGSMEGRSIELVKQAAGSLLQWLTRRDHISVVTFSEAARLVLPHVQLTDKPSALEKIRQITADGGTNLSGGLLEGLNDIALNYRQNELHYVILLTDGQANVGVTDPGQLARITASFLEKGIHTTTFGFGNGFNEDLLTKLAGSGGGRFAYIDGHEAIQTAFQNEFSALNNVVIQNLAVNFAAAPGVRLAEVFGGYPGDRTDSTFSLQLGDGMAEDTRHLLFNLSAETGAGKLAAVLGSLTCRGLDAADSFQPVVCEVKVKMPAINQPAWKTAEVKQELWLQQCLQIKQQALALADAKDFAAAGALVLEHARRLDAISHSRPELVSEQQNLFAMADKIKAGAYDASFRKQTVFQAAQVMQNQGQYCRDASIEVLTAAFVPGKDEQPAEFAAMIKRKLQEANFPYDSAGRVLTVLAELVGNALKHGCAGRPAGKVEASVTLAETYAQINVSDDGPGFDPEATLKKLLARSASFEPGSRGLLLTTGICSRLVFSDSGRQVEAVVMKDSGSVKAFAGKAPEGVRLIGKIAVLAISEGIDMFNYKSIKERIDHLLDNSYVNLVIDCIGITHIDSAGLSFFIIAMQRVMRKGGRLALANLNSYLSGVIRIVALQDILPIFDTVDDALASMGSTKTFTVDISDDQSQPN
ncbi:MAG TPA: VWA domain-containing protein [Candidatus Rifleibacterium sp.]|nr:VWA domain-containing protein [Candidatus Rifleibacterium sp.]